MFHVKQILFLILFLPFLGSAQHLGRTTLPLGAMTSFPKKDTAVLSFLRDFPDYYSLNSEQKDWFYWTNYSRSKPKEFWDSIIGPILINFPTLKTPNITSLRTDLINSKSLPYVKPYKNLLSITQVFASELADKGAPPSHTSPSGSTFSDRMKSSGIINCAGENISYGPSDPVLMLVLLYIDEGVANLGHRKSLLNESFVNMGIGIARYSNDNTIIIQDFACRQKE